jgi:hypothetical protein
MWNICCAGNPNHALYFAWHSIVRCRRGNAEINLLLNRASPWLDLDSYLPHEGRVVIKNKTATNLAVRIPGWVERRALTAERNGKPASLRWVGNYTLFSGLHPADVITLQFPVVERQEKYTLKWKKTDWWMEGTNPGNRWKNDHPTQYVLHFKGNTLVDVSPRSPDAAYPAFKTDHYEGENAPTKKVRRFVPSVDIAW